MQNGYYTSTGGMVAQMNRFDVISNNIANSNTAGYKRDDLVFADYMRLSREYKNELPIDNHTREGAKFLNRSLTRTPHVAEEYTKFDLGPLMQTDNDLDVALTQKDMFFAVQTQNGLRLTKNGSFSVNSDGNLVTKDGNLVLSKDFKPINVPQSSKIDFDKNGVIYADKNPIDALLVLQVPNTKYLEKEGGTNFIPRNLADLKVIENSGMIRQGFVEKSNINPISEMVALVEIQRNVDMYQKAMNTHMNELNQEAISKISQSKA